MHEELAHYVLDQLKKRGADDVIVHLGTSDNAHLKFSNNKILTTKSWDNSSIGLFVAKDKRIVLTSLKTFTKQAADDMITKVLQGVPKIPPNPQYRGIAKGPFKYKHIESLYDPGIENMQEEMIDITQHAITTVREKAKRAAGVLERNTGETLLLTSNGVEAREKGSSLYFSIRALVDKNASGHLTAVSRRRKDLDYLSAAHGAAEIAAQAKGTRKSLSGSYDVIFSPMAFANVLERVGQAASIFSVEAGLSFLQDKQGKTVGSNSITLYDDGTIPGGYGSAVCDDEGVPTQRNTIIEKGVLRGYLHNTSTATRYKTKTTANAGLISPEPHNIVMKGGDATKEDIFRSVKKGVYITNVWYTRFQNHLTGDFSTIPRDGAFYIENGKIKHPLKDIRVSENILEMLKNISLVGKDVTQVKSWEVEIPTFCPHVLVKNVRITKPT